VSALPVEAGGGGGGDGAPPPPPSDTLVLRLYVTGNTLRSTRAVDNARRLLETHATGRFELEVIEPASGSRDRGPDHCRADAGEAASGTVAEGDR